jgi:hypothetical protein
VGRLENIIERNRHPGRHRKRKGLVGIGLATLVVFVALILLIFTDLANPPEAAKPPGVGDEQRSPAVKPDTVRGVPLWREPQKKPTPTPKAPAPTQP